MPDIFGTAGFDAKGEFIFFMDGTPMLPEVAETHVLAVNAAGSGVDITSQAVTSGTVIPASAIMTSGQIYIGHTEKFCSIRHAIGSGQAAVSGGNLTVGVWDGSNWATLTSTAWINGGNDLQQSVTSDGTAFAQDGFITFNPPKDWAVGGPTGCNSDKYYAVIWYGYPVTPPRPDVLCPVFPQSWGVPMVRSYSGYLATPKSSQFDIETDRGDAARGLVFRRQKDENTAMIGQLSFTLALEGAGDEYDLLKALACGNPGTADWSQVGTSTDGLSVVMALRRGNRIWFPGLQDAGEKSFAAIVVKETEQDTLSDCYPVCIVAEDAKISRNDNNFEVTVPLVSLCEPIHGYQKHLLPLMPSA